MQRNASDSSDSTGHILFCKDRMKFFTPKPIAKQFQLCTKTETDIEKLTIRPNDILDLRWNNKTYHRPSFEQMNEINFLPNCRLSKLQHYLLNPEMAISADREHKVYANSIKKPSLMPIEEYYSVGSCRVGKYTQLGILLQDLQKRVLTVDIFSKDCIFMTNLVLKIVAEFHPYRPT